jgi:hypothetical protein
MEAFLKRISQLRQFIRKVRWKRIFALSGKALAALVSLSAVASAFFAWQSARESARATEATLNSLAIERQPVLVLECSYGNIVGGTIEGGRKYTSMLLLGPGRSGLGTTNDERAILPVISLVDKMVTVYRCSVTNYGRLPVLNLTGTMVATFARGNQWPGPVVATYSHEWSIPAIPPGGSEEFVVINPNKALVVVKPSIEVTVDDYVSKGNVKSFLRFGPVLDGMQGQLFLGGMQNPNPHLYPAPIE